MRILIPVLGFGKTGGYRVLSELASAWQRGGHTVDFISPDTSALPYFPTSAGIVWTNGKGGISLREEQPTFSARSGWKLMLALYRGVKKIGDDYDVVLANHSFTPWAIWLARLVNPAKFYYIQAYEPEYYFLERRPIQWILSRLSYVLPFCHIVNTEIYARYRGVSGDNVVPFGIDLKKFLPKEIVPSYVKSDQIVIGCIGRAEPAKGTAYVLKAFENLWTSDKRYKLRVAYGNFPDNWNHEAVEVIQPQNDYELAAFYRSLDVLIVAGTVQHGAPHYPVLEGMASGVPVVHTGYLPGNENNSWLARNRDSESICEQVNAIARHPDLREKLSRALDDVQKFEWDFVANMMVDIFTGNLVSDCYPGTSPHYISLGQES